MSNSRVTNYTCAVVQLNARLKPEASYGHFLSCFGAQKTMLFPQEAGHPLSFPPAWSFHRHLLGLWDHGHYDSTKYPGNRGCMQYSIFLFNSLLTGMDTCAYD